MGNRKEDQDRNDKTENNVAYGSVVKDKDKRRKKIHRDHAKKSVKWYDEIDD